MTTRPPREITVREAEGHRVASFSAMACPCEVLLAEGSVADAQRIGELVAAEAWRVEDKYSRYLDGNIVHTLNHADGARTVVDAETLTLLGFADTCFRLSEGRFDITSGALRRAWTFDGSDSVPDASAIDAARAAVGWDRIEFDGTSVRMPPEMELDFGGLGKEYAVDRAAAIAAENGADNCLISFGGDLVALGPGVDGTPWRVGIDPIESAASAPQVALVRGGVATSGDTRRFIQRDGIRYGHILDPITGWPVTGAPRTVTVLAANCMQAGMLATMAMLRGGEAEAFLDEQDLEYWIQR